MNTLLNQSVSRFKMANILIVLLVLQFIFLLVANYLLMDDSLYYDFLGDKLSYERIDEIIENNKTWKWVSYVILPLLLLVKCYLIAVCLYIGTFFIGEERKTADLFKIVLITEFVFLLPIIIRIIWFGIFHRSYTLEDVSYFSPLSILNLANRKELDVWLVYPLQMLNVFEFLYWFVLAHLLKGVINRSFLQSLGLVASTYGVGLFIWVLMITFLTVSLS